MRTPLVVGNWKLHKTVAESITLAEEVVGLVAEAADIEVILAPTFVALAAVAQVLRGARLGLAAQNLFWEPSGAYTGEISAPLLKAAGCSHVILGHSERRQFFGDTNDQINRRVHAALAADLGPIVCVGERLEERRAECTERVIAAQLEGTLDSLTAEQISAIIIAYEPVWAIGTGATAAPADAQAVHHLIRTWLGKRASNAASGVRILYGGSVTAANSAALMREPDIDGALVGGASLVAEEFAAIVRSGVIA